MRQHIAEGMRATPRGPPSDDEEEVEPMLEDPAQEERAMDELMNQYFEVDNDGDDGMNEAPIFPAAPPRQRDRSHHRQWEEARGHARTRIF